MDLALAQTPMPEEFANKSVGVLCNDCQVKTENGVEGKNECKTSRKDREQEASREQRGRGESREEEEGALKEGEQNN